MPIICVIEFDNNPHGVYFAGEEVTGRVTLQTDELKKVNAVVLKISGFAQTHWTDNDYSHDNYMESVTYLMGSKEGTLISMEPNTYSYNFECHIPKECPSSFEGLYGHIRYTVTLSIVRPWEFDNTFTRDFSVAKVEDLDYDNLLLYKPVTKTASTTYGLGPFMNSGSLNIIVSIPQSVYVPGQNMPISVFIGNESDVPVKELIVSLVMHIYYHGRSSSNKIRKQEIQVIKAEGESVQQLYCTKNFNYDFLIPATPPTCLNLCRSIKISYELKVEANVTGWHMNPVACIPVTIDNMPLPNVVDLQHISKQDELNGLSESSNVNSTILAEEAVNMQNSITTDSPIYAEAIDQKSFYSRAVAINPEDSSIVSIGNNAVITEEHFGHTVFKEAIHARDANKLKIKNAFSPRYPYYRHMFRETNNEKDKNFSKLYM